MKINISILAIAFLISLSSLSQNVENNIRVDSTQIQRIGDSYYIAHQTINKETSPYTSIRYSKLEFNTILFEKSKAKILSQSFNELNRIVELLKNNTGIVIHINGHTDRVGNSKKNQQLSLKRAKAIKKFLVKSNIQPKRIDIEGFGDKYPICESPCKKNRRVEFIISGEVANNFRDLNKSWLKVDNSSKSN